MTAEKIFNAFAIFTSYSFVIYQLSRLEIKMFDDKLELDNKIYKEINTLEKRIYKLEK